MILAKFHYVEFPPLQNSHIYTYIQTDSDCTKRASYRQNRTERLKIERHKNVSTSHAARIGIFLHICLSTRSPVSSSSSRRPASCNCVKRRKIQQLTSGHKNAKTRRTTWWLCAEPAIVLVQLFRSPAVSWNQARNAHRFVCFNVSARRNPNTRECPLRLGSTNQQDFAIGWLNNHHCSNVHASV